MDRHRDVPSRLRLAREALGYSTRQVAERIKPKCDISHATIANYEAGRSSPGIDVLRLLADFYSKPLDWFLGPTQQLTGVRYRCFKSKLTQGNKVQYESQASQLLEGYVKLEQAMGRPLIRRHTAERRPGQTPSEFAEQIRSQLGLNKGDPIYSVVEVLEAYGIRTVELASHLPIDGISAKFAEGHAVVLNPEMSNDRWRFSAGHELTHILEEHCYEGSNRHDSGDEKWATSAASHLLLPQTQLIAAFDGQSMVRLVQYKEKFGISLAAMVYRASEAKIISDDVSKWLWKEFAIRGWKKKEPGSVRPDRAIRFESLVEEAINLRGYSWQDVERITGLSRSELEEREAFASGHLPTPRSSPDGENPERPRIFLGGNF